MGHTCACGRRRMLACRRRSRARLPPAIDLRTDYAGGYPDTGHKGTAFDASSTRDEQAAVDFGYQAIGRVAVLPKQVVAFYYGRDVQRAYFTGCSPGGRVAMMMSQRYTALRF